MERPRNSRHIPGAVWCIFGVIVGFPSFVFFDKIGNPDKGLVATISIAEIISVSGILWRTNNGLRFFFTLFIFILIHAFLVTVVRFPISFPVPKSTILLLAPLVYIDFLSMIIILNRYGTSQSNRVE